MLRVTLVLFLHNHTHVQPFLLGFNHGSLQSSLLSLELSYDLEPTDVKEVQNALLKHDLVMLRVHDLDNPNESASMGAFLEIQGEHQLKELFSLSIRQVTIIVLIKLLVNKLNVVQSLLLLAPRLVLADPRFFFVDALESRK